MFVGGVRLGVWNVVLVVCVSVSGVVFSVGVCVDLLIFLQVGPDDGDDWLYTVLLK